MPVDLTANARDYTTSETSFVFADYACKEMYEASPRQIFVGVPSSVSVGVVGSSIRLFTHGSVCVFDGQSSEAYVGSDAQSVGCYVRSQAQGFAPISIDMDRNSAIVASVAPMHLARVEPSVVLADGGSVVYVHGEHMLGDEVLCHVHGLYSSATRESSSLVRCELPGSTEAAREVALAMADSSAAPPVLNAGAGAFVDFVHAFGASGVYPDVGTGWGGSLVRIIVSDIETSLASSTASCRFGTIGPLLGRIAGIASVECISPAHVVGELVPVGASDAVVAAQSPFGGIDTPHVQYAYVLEPEVHAVDPPAVSLGGALSQAITVYGARFSSAAMACTIGADVMPASLAQSLDSVACAMPAAASAGFAGVALQLTSSDTTGIPLPRSLVRADPTVLEIFEPPLARAAVPSMIDADSPEPLHILGAHFVTRRPGAEDTAMCVFASIEGTVEASSGHVLSSAVMRCPAPAGMRGRRGLQSRIGTSAHVSMMRGGWDYTAKDSAPRIDRGDLASAATATALLHIAVPLQLAGAHPLAGPDAGGTVVSVYGDNFPGDDAAAALRPGAPAPRSGMACRFGTVRPVHARVESSHAAKCLSPASYPGGDGLLSVSRDRGRSFALSLPVLTFEPRSPAAIRAVVPSVGVTTGGTPVFVVGYNFVNSTGLRCRFGATEGEATFLSSASLLCVAPRTARAGPVFLEISDNGVDWTAERMLFTYTTCPSGSYCPAHVGEPVQCPRGAACPGGATNFTLCQPGTFAPEEGMASCLPAPVGHYVPGFGAADPSVCAAGWVCDVSGLSALVKPCPAGHVCGPGTWTSNFTDFSVAERPLPCPFGYACGPGVATPSSILGNYSTPQPCYAGYVCPPGSTSPQGNGPCPTGFFCPPGRMIACPPRASCPGVGRIAPLICGPGTWNNEYGQSACKLAPRGTIAPGFGRDLPVICPRGMICATLGLGTASTRCVAGHYCGEGTLTENPLASLDEAQLIRVSPIPLNPDSMRPQPCLPATYCTSGVGNNVTIEGDFSAPQPCKEGSACGWSTSDRIDDVLDTATSQSTTGDDSASSGARDISNAMIKCPSGHYCPKGTYIPIPAPRGSFARGTGNAAATPCLPGTYTPYEGFDACLPTPAGYETPFDGSYKPSLCKAGTFRSLRDGITCRSCPMGSWGIISGATESSQCVPCNPGTVCGVEGMTNNKPNGESRVPTNEFVIPCEEAEVTVGEDGDPETVAECYMVEQQPLGQATLCTEGYVCDARTTVAVSKCPDGYFCGYGTSPETQFVNMCPPGYYCPEGTSASSRNQNVCLRCHYCPEGTGIILPRCVEGTESSPGATSIVDCRADGITFWQVQPLRNELMMYVWARELGNLGDAGNSTDPDALVPYDSTFDYSVLAGFPPSPPPPTPPPMPPDALVSPPPPPPPPPMGNASNTTSGGGFGTDAADSLVDLAVCKASGFEKLRPEIVYVERDLLAEVLAPKIPYNDTLGRVMTKYSLEHNQVAKLTFDFRNINPEIYYSLHYEIVIFTGTSVDRTKCNEGTAEHKKVPCPPWNTGDGINVKTMGVYEDRLFEDKCPPNTEAVELPYWLSFYKPPDGNPLLDPTKPYDGLEFVRKRSIVELNLHATIATTFRVEVRLLHGLFQKQSRDGFQDTLCIDVTESSRAAGAPRTAFHIVTPRNDDYQLPLNIPLTEVRFRQYAKVRMLGYRVSCVPLPPAKVQPIVAVVMRLEVRSHSGEAQELT